MGPSGRSRRPTAVAGARARGIRCRWCIGCGSSTDDVWAQFRAAAELGLTLGNYVGQLAEAEAYRLGWRNQRAE